MASRRSIPKALAGSAAVRHSPPAPAETDPATVAVFAKAVSQAMTMVKDYLS